MLLIIIIAIVIVIIIYRVSSRTSLFLYPLGEDEVPGSLGTGHNQ